MLEGATDGHVGQADGDGAEGVGVEVGVCLQHVERALGREGVVVAVDAGDDFTLFWVGIGGDSEEWSVGSWSGGGLRSWCAWKRDGRRVDEGDGGDGEFWADGSGSGRGHVVLAWEACWR